MNWNHVKTIVWLRWRLSLNQWERAGTFNKILTLCFLIAVMVSAFCSFFVALGAGIFLLPHAAPYHILIAWDVLAVGFVFIWSIGLLIEVQRSDMVSLDRLLHWPISVSSGFVLNYVASLSSMYVVCFVPAALGFNFALIVTRGWQFIFLLPIIASFLFCITAVTYHLRGWLVSLMANPRRRRSIIVGLTIGFVLMTQLPNVFIQISLRRSRTNRGAQSQVSLSTRMQEEQSAAFDVMSDRHSEERDSLRANRESMERDEYQSRREQLRERQTAEMLALPNKITAKYDKLRAEEDAANQQLMLQYCEVANRCVPIGWLPYAALQLARGAWWQAGLCWCGLTVIGVGSLWRSYFTTVRFYTQSHTAKRQGKKKATREEDAPQTKTKFIERPLPVLDEQKSAIALSSFLSLLRAPESKMAMIMPLFVFLPMAFVFGFSDSSTKGTGAFYALVGVGTLIMSVATQAMNSLGADPGGFRACVLMPVARRSILIGKNMSLAPVLSILTVTVVGAVMLFKGMSIWHAIATLLQTVSLFCVTALAGNLAAILAPYTTSTASMKAAKPNLKTSLIHLLCFFIIPLAGSLGAVALLAETLLRNLADIHYLPLYLVVSLVEAPIAIVLYRRLIVIQGGLLQRRETKVLERLTHPDE